jgi:hypothetical protein
MHHSFFDLLPVYSFDDVKGDTSLNNFNINAAPSYLFSVIKDIMYSLPTNGKPLMFQLTEHGRSVNDVLKVHVVPWSPVRLCSCVILLLVFNAPLMHQPGWMKNGGTMNGGSLTTSLVNTCEIRCLRHILCHHDLNPLSRCEIPFKMLAGFSK